MHKSMLIYYYMKPTPSETLKKNGNSILAREKETTLKKIFKNEW